MHFDDQVEIGRLHFGEALVAQDPGVVDQDVHAAPGFLRACDQRQHLVEFGDRAAIGDRLAAAFQDFLDNLLRRVRRACAIAGPAQIVDHDFGATFCEFQRIGAAKATARSGYDCDASFERNGHTASLLRAPNRALNWRADAMVEGAWQLIP